MTAYGRHAAPRIGHDAATCPMCLRAGWASTHNPQPLLTGRADKRAAVTK